jgi:tetratricopeptide (TPR) repeat protein
MQTRGFTPTGAPITTFIFLLFGLGTSLILLSRSTRFQLRSLFTFTTALHIISLIALGFLLLPGQELAFHLLPWTASWSIALDALKNMKSLFFGVGLSGYTDFTASVKPLFLNSTIFWDQTISSATSELLQLLTTTGIIGFLTYLSLPLVAFQLNSKIDFKADTIRLCLLLLAAVSFLTLVFTPSTLPILFVFFTAIGALSATPTRTHNLSLGVSLLTGLVSILVAIFVGYYTYQAYTAEWHMRNAQLGVISNNGKVVYDESLAAVKLMPNLTSYHLSYSQVNLSLASALSQKSPLSDSDRQNVTQLVAQAVNEAKNATILRPHSAVVWQNLGSIYRNLINVADGSDQFAISAYAQALTLDPGNPGLRLEYGGLLYQLGVASKNASDQTTLFTRAQSEFQTAISVKPDYANAYYNLSKLLESSKDYSNAYLSLQKAISLLGPESQDLGRASAELETLKAKVPKSTPAPSTIPSTATTPTLSNPSPLPSPISGDKIPLPTPTP